jgi:hypothetical protein
MPGYRQQYFFPGGLEFTNLTVAGQKTFLGTTQFWLLPWIDQTNLMLLWDYSDVTQSDGANDLPNPPGGNANFAQDIPNPATPAQALLIPYTPKLFLCPSDPSGVNFSNGISNGNQPTTSYLVNGQIFNQIVNPKIPSHLPDGVSTTAMFFEGYAWCNGTNINLADMQKISASSGTGTGQGCNGNVNNNRERRIWRTGQDSNHSTCAYCDNGAQYASDQTNPVVYTYPSTNPYLLFQPQPNADHCDQGTTQASHTAGTNVLMGDASVKLVSPRVSFLTWHASITPNRRDILGTDW